MKLNKAKKKKSLKKLEVLIFFYFAFYLILFLDVYFSPLSIYCLKHIQTRLENTYKNKNKENHNDSLTQS